MPHRTCAAPGCDTILSLYNPENICSACARHMSRAQDVRKRRTCASAGRAQAQARPKAGTGGGQFGPEERSAARPLSAAVMTTAGQLAVGHWVSGQKIASRARLTRNAVCKHVEALRRAGWQVESRSNLGYKLVKKGRTSRPGELLDAAPSSQARQAPPSPLRGEPARGGGA